MNKILTLVLIVFLLAAAPSKSQDISRVGTSAAQFLKLGVGARAGALGEAAVTVASDVTGLYWNPASISSLQRTSLAVSRNELYAKMAYDFFGVVQPLGGSSSIGISALYLDSRDMEITTLSNPDGTGSYFSWEAYCIGITYSRFVTDRLSLGGTVKYIREGAYHQKAHTVAIDLGSILDTGVMGLKLGMCLSNFGGQMRLSGPGLGVTSDRYPNNPGALTDDAYLKTEGYPLPLIFRLGLASELVGAEGQLMKSSMNRMTVFVDAYDPNDALLRSNLGFEYEWNKILSLRAGYRGISVEDDAYDSYNTASYTFGGGIQYDLKVAHVQFDYCLTDFKILGTGHIFSMVLAF